MVVETVSENAAFESVVSYSITAVVSMATKTSSNGCVSPILMVPLTLSFPLSLLNY